MKRNVFLKFAVALSAAAVAGKASAAVSFIGSDPSNDQSASVTFSTSGNDLIVTLVNTYALDTPDQAHLLTAVFFSGAGNLTPVSAAAGSGSTEWNGSSKVTLQGSSTLGQQWEYLNNIGASAPDGATVGISSTGINIFGKGNFASGGVAVDGSAYGILSAGYNGSAGDGLASQGPDIQNSMVFTLSGFTGSLSSINDIVFLYGTSQGDNFFAAVPEANFGLGATLALLPVIGFCGLKRFRPVLA